MATALDRTIETLTARLLEKRNSQGHWEGRLASSALSTATAIVALILANERADLVRSGIAWLGANQNEDGGWGDTDRSFSNLSTTLLVWAALHNERGSVVERAEAWLRREVGELSPKNLREKIIARYGKDRTFSAPILTLLALAGRLGPAAGAWRLVPQLPFELAACPHRLFRWLRLPVVSYALPALVAIGQSRHHRAPSRNPVAAGLRSALRSKTLAVARSMQPESGGYLEAIPLTAFVTMNLIDSGARHDPIVANGIRFLTASVREDGSWPIDTNLATWVTSLSINTLGGGEQRVLDWLLTQQVSVEHPFTHAKPGGWAWTNLTGGVPDADDTSGALIALSKLSGIKHVDAAERGVRWLLDLQNSDGGIPTFCRGWGALPFDRSAPDLTAHALEAWSVWHPVLGPDLQRSVERAATRGIEYLARAQRPDGSWLPLWFGNQHVADETNPTYGTARVLAGLSSPLAQRLQAAKTIHGRGMAWLLKAQNVDGGWGGAPGAPSSIEETGLALEVIRGNAAVRGAKWLIEASEEGRKTPASPIGLYFARLWYYEDLYPILFALRGLKAVCRPFTEADALG